MKKIYFLIINAVLIILFGHVLFFNPVQNAVFAIENQYSNQLLKLNLEKSKNSGINVKLITTKPFKLKLSPIKRANDEYIIFLPETFHSITTRPDVSALSGIVEDIDVKLVPYIGQTNNGYTKIVIKTAGENLKLNINNEIYKQTSAGSDDLTKLVLAGNSKAKSPVSPAKNKTTGAVPQNIVKSPVTAPKVQQSLNKAVNRTPLTVDKVQKESITSPENQKTQPAQVIQDKAIESRDTTVFKPETIKKPAVNTEQNAVKNVAVTRKIDNTNNNKAGKLMTILVYAIVILGLFFLLRIIRKKKAALIKTKPAQSSDYSDSENILSRLSQSRPQSPVSKDLDSDNEDQNDNMFPDKNSLNNIYEIRDVESEEEYVAYIPEIFEDGYGFVELEDSEYIEEEYGNGKVSAGTVAKPSQDINAIGEDLEIIEGLEISDKKAFYLVQLEDEIALIGINNSEVFVLKKFDNTVNPELSVRKTDDSGTDEIFYVQVDKWRGLISTGHNEMSLEMVF